MNENNPTGSLYALGVLRHDKDDEREALQSAAAQFILEAEEAKWAPALQWFENLSYLCGNPLTKFYRAGGELRTHVFGIDDTSAHDHIIAQSSDNRLVRPFETVTGMLTQSRPKPRVAPRTREIEDEDAAKIAALVTNLTFENPLRMPELQGEAAAIAMLMGTAIAETEFGETDLPMIVPKMVTREYEDEGRPGMPLTEEVEDGETTEWSRDIQCRLWTPFHFAADPRATSDRDALFFQRSSFEDLYWIREQYDRKEEGFYPEALDSLGENTASRCSLFWWSRFQDVLVSPQYWQSTGMSSQRWSQTGTAPNQGFTTVIDVKPSLMFPRGRTIVMVNGKLVYCGEQARAWTKDYPWRWHPYSLFHWLKLPGRFLGLPLLSFLVPLQKRINAIDATVRANREHFAIGQWKIARQSRVAEGTITGVPGQHIVYTAVPNVPEPHRVEHVPLPGELLAERADLVQAIDVIAATGVLGADLAKSSARAGIMLDFLREERLRSKGPMLKSYEQFLERIGQHVLIEYQNGLLEEDPELTRRLQVAAKEFPSITVKNFTGASLRDHHAVSIDIASDLLQSPEAKKELAGMALQFLGANASPSQLNAILKAMGLDEVVQNEQMVSVERARRMISATKAEDFKVPGKPETTDLGVRAAALGIMPGVDEPAIMVGVFKEYLQTEQIHDHTPEVKAYLIEVFDVLSALAQQQAMQQIQARLAMMAQEAAITGKAKEQSSGRTEQRAA